MTWTRLDRRLHWATAGLFAWQFASRWIAERLPEGHEAIFHLNGLHSLGGYAILGLGIWRLWNRFRRGRPPLLSSSRTERLLARLSHATLYLMLFVQPVTGVLSVGQAETATVTVARLMHDWGSVLIAVLILVHAGAAVWHHLVRKDDTLRRMIGS